MKKASNSQQDTGGYAVIRRFEPTRVEHELLAQVFEVLSHTREDDDAGRKADVAMQGPQNANEAQPLTEHASPCVVVESLEPAV